MVDWLIGSLENDGLFHVVHVSKSLQIRFLSLETFTALKVRVLVEIFLLLFAEHFNGSLVLNGLGVVLKVLLSELSDRILYSY